MIYIVCALTGLVGFILGIIFILRRIRARGIHGVKIKDRFYFTYQLKLRLKEPKWQKNSKTSKARK